MRRRARPGTRWRPRWSRGRRRCVGEAETPHPSPEAGPVREVGLEVAPSLSDEVIADVRGAIAGRAAFGGLARALHRAQRHPHLRLPGGLGLRELLHGLPVSVAAQEVHARVRARRVALQHALDEAHRLEVLAPVEGRAQPEARDHVRHRDQARRLPLVLAADRVLRSRLPGFEVLVHRGAHRGQPGPVLAEALEELHDIGGMQVPRQRRRRAVHVGIQPRHVRVGGPPRRAGLERLLGQAPQVLDEGELQHARPGPQLADGQRRHRLVAVHEAHELLPVQAAVAVADELDGHGVDPRVPRQLPERELRQLAVVAGGQVAAHVEDHRGDEVEVVEQPLRGRGHKGPAVNVLGHGQVGGAEDAGVVVEPREDVPRHPPGVGVEGEPGGEGLGPLFQALDAQQLVAQRLLGRGPRPRPPETDHLNHCRAVIAVTDGQRTHPRDVDMDQVRGSRVYPD